MEDLNLNEDADVGFQNGFIRLEQIPTVYYSGQTINGSVVFDLRQPLTINVLYVQFLGEAKVCWTEEEIQTVHGRQEVKYVKYTGRQEYFNYTQNLAGGDGVTELPRTHQSFPFSYQIPFLSPSSFEGDHGTVTYTIIATILYPDMNAEELTKTFTVVAPFDLNTGNPRLRDAIGLEFEEVYTCCCSSNPMTVRVNLPVSGYCPGQNIPVTVEVNNNSSIEITKLKYEIIMRELYRSQQPVAENIPPETILCTKKLGAIMGNCKESFTCDLIVPDMIVPNLENCSIIDIGYFFRVKIKLSGCNNPLQDEAEICLGLVPLRETLNGEYRHPMAESLPSGPIPVNDMATVLIVPPVERPFGSRSNLSRSQQSLAQMSMRSTGRPYGSNTSLNRSQQNIAYPPPYPGNNTSYPSGNNSHLPVKPTLEIGFRTPERLSTGDVPYPGAVPMGNMPPYPTTHVMPGAHYPASSTGADVPPPYPTSPGSDAPPPYPAVVGNAPYPGQSYKPPYAPGGFAPSAPPEN